MIETNKFASEKDFLEMLDRIARNQSAYSVLYVNLSKLKPRNRHPSFVKIIAQLFDTLVGSAEGSLFTLSNGDFAILGSNITSETVARAVEKLRQGLATDPMLLNSNISEFARLYYFPNDYTTLYEHIQQLISNDSQTLHALIKKPLKASQMEGILAHLELINIAEIVKRQSVISLTDINNFKVIFQEFFVAIKDLSTQYDRTIDLPANKWLFAFLTQALDKKTIASLPIAEIKNWPSAISLNLHLSTIFTPEFEAFITDNMLPNRQIIAEVQMMDVFNKLESYFAAKEKLHSQGNKILIDSLIPDALPLVDIQRLDPDYIKLFWDPMLEFDTNNQNLRNTINHLGSERIILAKCTDNKAIRWGVSYGIRNFQGPYIDNMETTVIRSQCPEAANCDAASCLKRRRLICGIERQRCQHHEHLEQLLGQDHGN